MYVRLRVMVCGHCGGSIPDGAVSFLCWDAYPGLFHRCRGMLAAAAHMSIVLMKPHKLSLRSKKLILNGGFIIEKYHSGTF